MANIYPNIQAANFSSWLLTSTYQTFSAARVVLINKIITAYNSASYVTQADWVQFIYVSNPYWSQYQQWLTLQPATPQPTSYDTLTTAWLGQVSSPSQQTIYAVDAFFKQLRADGNLLLDYCFLFAQDNQANSRVSLINPSLYNVTEHSSPTWNAYLGYTGNGSSSYLATNFNDSANGVNYSLNNGSMGCYLRLNVSASSSVNMGSRNSSLFTQLSIRYASTTAQVSMNGLTEPNISNANTQGLAILRRQSSSSIELSLNASVLGSSTQTSSALSPKNDYIMAWNNTTAPGFFDNNQYSLAFKGSGNINLVTFNSAVNLLMTNLGAHY